METTATVRLVVNGEEASSELSRLKSRVIDLRTELEKAEKSGDKLSVKKLTHDLDIVERQLSKLENESSDVSEVIKNLGGRYTDIDYRNITDFNSAVPYFLKRNKMLRNLSGMNLLTIGAEFEKMLNLYNTMSESSKGGSYILSNGVELSYSSKSDFKQLLDTPVRDKKLSKIVV